MEAADVELAAQFDLGPRPDRPQPDLTDLVGRGLARPADIALQFGLDVQRGEGGVVAETGAGLLQIPAQPVDTGVRHQPAGAPHLVAEAAEPLIGGAVEAHLLPEEFGVQAPALDEGGDVDAAPEIGAVRCFLLQGDLQVVAGDAFVQRQGRHLIEAALVQAGGVDHIAAGDTVLHRAGVVAAGGVVGLDLARHGAHAIGQARQGAEQGRQAVVGPLGHLRRLLDQGLAAGDVELRIGAQEGKERGEIAGPAGGTHLGIHAAPDTGDLLQADGVDLVRRQPGRGEAAHQIGIHVATARTMNQTEGLGRPGQIVLAQEARPFTPLWHDAVRYGPGGARPQGRLLRRRDGGGEGSERLEQRVGVRRQGRLGLDQGQGVLDDGAGLDHAGLKPAPGIGQRIGIEFRHRLEPGDPGFGVSGGDDPGDGGDIGEVLTGSTLGVEGVDTAGVERDTIP